MSKKEVSAGSAGNVLLGGEVSVHRLGFGAMRLTGEGIWGPPRDKRRRWPFFAARWSSTSNSSTPPIPMVRT